MPPNVLLIVMDTVRARNVSLYGANRKTTPELEDLAADATVYTQAKSPSNWTLPSHASIFTGKHVPEHQVTSHYDELRPGETIWETLRDDHGYATGLFSSNATLGVAGWGLNRGFDKIIDKVRDKRYPFTSAPSPSDFELGDDGEETREYIKSALHSGKPVRAFLNGAAFKLHLSDVPYQLPATNQAVEHTREFINWTDDQTGPWAACVNFMDAHFPYQPTGDHDIWGDDQLGDIQQNLENPNWTFYSGRKPWWQSQALESLYDGAIRQEDAAISRIVEHLRETDQLDDTLIVVTSDHGEGFGEQSRVRPGFRLGTHNAGLHEVLVHVPLLVYHPDCDGAVVDEPVSLVEFPRVVRAELSGGASREAFVSDNPVVAAGYYDRQYEFRVENDWGALSPDLQEEVDLDMFAGMARAVYEVDNGRLTKYLSWDAETVKVEIEDAQNSMAVSRPDEDPTVEIFERLSGDLRVDASGEGQEVSEDVQERLQNLGYG